MGIGSAELLIIVMISLPTMLALVKRHPHRAGIFLANIAGWFTFGGWMVACAGCCVEPAKAVASWDRCFRPATRP
jgi:hypothetical protein